MRQVKGLALAWSVVLWFGVSACSSQDITLVNPISAATAKCSASGTGLGTGWATDFVNSCVGRYRNLGYVPVDELSPEQRADLQKRGSLP